MLKRVQISFLKIRNCFFLAVLFLIVSCSTADTITTADLDVKPEGEILFSFGIIADCQYSDKSGNWFMNRYYSRSAEKLRDCIKVFNSSKPEFVIHLGDLIDEDYKSFDLVLPIYNSLKMPHYQVLGNHDFTVADEKKLLVPSKLGMKNRYYDFVFKGWRFIVLDGNDISLHAWPKNSSRFNESYHYYKSNGIKSPEWNGAVGPGQLRWLRERLAKAAKGKEKAVVFCHYPVLPAGNDHNLWNAREVISVIESYSCVKAYINGHDHRGGYKMEKGIHYLTVPGMVETKKKTSYGVVHLYKNALVIDGTGMCPDLILPY